MRIIISGLLPKLTSMLGVSKASPAIARSFPRPETSQFFSPIEFGSKRFLSTQVKAEKLFFPPKLLEKITKRFEELRLIPRAKIMMPPNPEKIAEMAEMLRAELPEKILSAIQDFSEGKKKALYISGISKDRHISNYISAAISYLCGFEIHPDKEVSVFTIDKGNYPSSIGPHIDQICIPTPAVVGLGATESIATTITGFIDLDDILAKLNDEEKFLLSKLSFYGEQLPKNPDGSIRLYPVLYQKDGATHVNFESDISSSSPEGKEVLSSFRKAIAKVESGEHFRVILDEEELALFKNTRTIHYSIINISSLDRTRVIERTYYIDKTKEPSVSVGTAFSARVKTLDTQAIIE